MYNLTPQVRVPDNMLRPLTEALDLGRFAAHVEAAGRLLPRLVLHERVPEITLPPSAARVDGAAITLAVTPRWDPLLFVDVEIADDADVIADTLYATWQDRSATRVGGAPLAEWLDGRLRAYGVPARPADQPPLKFGRNVHQSVFPGAALARGLLAEHVPGDAVGQDVVTIVLRGTLDDGTGATLGIRRPETLNNPGQTMVAHGRGVSLIVGYAPPVENAFGLARPASSTRSRPCTASGYRRSRRWSSTGPQWSRRRTMPAPWSRGSRAGSAISSST